MSVKHGGIQVILVMLALLMPCGAFAYGVDVHFNLTFVLCRLAGLEEKDALWIAAADQSMDTNHCTTAYESWKDFERQNNPSNPAKRIYIRNGANWHAFSDAGATDASTTDTGLSALNPLPPLTQYTDGGKNARFAIVHRRDELWLRVSNVPFATNDDKSRILADISLGQFLHFEQDYYSHRQLTKNANKDNEYLPYAPEFGHAHDFHKPDYVAGREDLAEAMAINSYEYIRKFVQMHNNSLAPLVQPVDLSKVISRLVKAVSSTYHFYNGVTDNSPSQVDLYNALKKELTKMGCTGVMDKKSLFWESKYSLPYDTPDTPLSNVKHIIEGLSGS